ncbi:hypothetical protein MMC20_005882 [Loxospora ochrophaea]|nr:hypothetical protein [Loxospora ochrophaea]
MVPLVGGLAPIHCRATALSITVSGLLLGGLLSRVLSGVFTQYAGWRNVYWLSLGIQYLIFCLLWLFMPDYPPESSKQINYLKLLWTIPKIVIHEPLLVQACLGGYLVCGPFASYWTTLTFLLSSPPYEYSSMVIGLFAFIGIAGLCFGPPFAHFIVDKFAPLFSVVVGELLCLCGVAIGTYTGSFTVAGPVIEAFAIDLGLQMTQIAQRKSIYSLDPSARNRINAAYMYSLTCGQIMGTTIGNKLYSEPDNGWVYSGSANMGFLALALLVCFARGPWEKRWIGWRGGWSPRQQSH